MTELRKHALLQEQAESITIDSPQSCKKCRAGLLTESRCALTTATFGSGVKSFWVRPIGTMPIRASKGKERSRRLVKLRTVLKACKEMVLSALRQAGKS